MVYHIIKIVRGDSSVAERRVDDRNAELAPSSIPKLAMRRCIFGKDTFMIIFHWGQAVCPL